jgi:hypothetical protein
VESLVRLYVQVHTAGLPGPSIPPCPDLRHLGSRGAGALNTAGSCLADGELMGNLDYKVRARWYRVVAAHRLRALPLPRHSFVLPARNEGRGIMLASVRGAMPNKSHVIFVVTTLIES